MGEEGGHCYDFGKVEELKPAVGGEGGGRSGIGGWYE